MLVSCFLSACAGRSLRAPEVAPVSVEEIVAEPREEQTETARAVPPWEVPSDEWLSQRLFRARFSTPEGSGRFKLTLHYSNPEQFQISATDPLGRSLWSLFVVQSEALLLEHRGKRACAFDEELDLSSLYLGSFPVRSLPSLLLGRVPAAPVGTPSWTAAGDVQILRFEDEAARRWTVRLPIEPTEGSLIESWSMKGATASSRAELSRDGDWWVLLDRRQDLELRWRQVVAEPLAGPVEVPSIPAHYEQGDCLAREI